MAITIKFVEFITGESPGTDSHDNFTTPHVITAATNINFGSTSARDLTPASFPITAGENSFDKYFSVQFSGSFTQLSNAKIWAPDVLVTGETFQFSGNIAYAAQSETDAADPLIETSAIATNNVGLDFYDSADLAATSRTLPNAIDVNSSPGFFSGSRSSIMRFQLLTTGSTPAGAVNQKTISLRYDRQ